MNFPDGTDVGYTYTTMGDLDMVTDQMAIDDRSRYLDDEAPTCLVYGHRRLAPWNDDGQPPAAVWEYDADGRVTRKADGEGVFTELDSLNLGTPTYTEVGPDPGLSTTYEYDGGGMLLSTTQNWDATAEYAAGSYVTSFTYEDAFSTTSVTGPNGGTTSYLYDDAGRLTWSHDPGGGLAGGFGAGDITPESLEIAQTTYGSLRSDSAGRLP